MPSSPPPPARPPLDWSGAAPFPFSRESRIRFDAEGRFFHEGVLVEHPGLARAMGSWMNRHPHDGRYVLDNGWDWCWLTVDDAPFVVRAVRIEPGPTPAMIVSLNDGTDASIDPADGEALWIDDAGGLRCLVHPEKRGGAMEARFDRHALASLGDRLVELEDGRDGSLGLAVGATPIPLRPRRVPERSASEPPPH
jgi:hypothetical protein